jgi:hypothetical protein
MGFMSDWYLPPQPTDANGNPLPSGGSMAALMDSSALGASDLSGHAMAWSPVPGAGAPVPADWSLYDPQTSFSDGLSASGSLGFADANGQNQGASPQPASAPAARLPYDNTPVPFLDWRGDPIIGPDGDAMMIPKGADPHFFVDQGLADRSAGWASTARSLANFGQGHPWDLQRQEPDKPMKNQFRDAASVAIGLYGAAAGVPQPVMLGLSGLYAAKNSTFPKDEPRDPLYVTLSKRNVDNTKLGYELYQTGRIGPTPGAP